ncbi:MAG: glycosyltransferase family 2 protein [Patescibacteria group bacterium]|nr:glycosyltransferase family 2 protein [Patescibacteria group bacterium]
MIKKITDSNIFHKIADSFVPFFSWIIITFPLWLSPFHPAVVSYFIISFNIYFFYKSFITAYYAVLSYKEILFHSKINYQKKIKKIKNSFYINHFVIIPNYKEHLYKLESTINSIIENDYPYKKINLVLAFEKRENEANNKYKILYKKYNKYFQKIFATFHPDIPEEEPGKASNQTFAAKIIDKYIEENNIERDKTIITICDADSHLPKNYFSYLTFTFLKDKERIYHFYWAPVLLYNNFWQLPIFVRIQATLSSILRLSFLSQKENLIQVSTYSTNMWLLKKINFWDVNIIPEDWHIFFQAFFKFGEKIKTIPLYTIVNGDAVFSGAILKTFINRYEQERRWAWGVSDVGYFIKNFFKTPHINLLIKLKKLFFLIETHLLWPVSFFILTISASIPPLINPVFKNTVLGFILPKTSALILTLTSSFLILYFYLDIKIREKIKIKTKISNLPILFVQWYFLPIVSFFFSSLPALDSHTRILFGKKLKYKVTEKI